MKLPPGATVPCSVESCRLSAGALSTTTSRENEIPSSLISQHQSNHSAIGRCLVTARDDKEQFGGLCGPGENGKKAVRCSHTSRNPIVSGKIRAVKLTVTVCDEALRLRTVTSNSNTCPGFTGSMRRR